MADLWYEFFGAGVFGFFLLLAEFFELALLGLFDFTLLGFLEGRGGSGVRLVQGGGGNTPKKPGKGSLMSHTTSAIQVSYW